MEHQAPSTTHQAPNDPHIAEYCLPGGGYLQAGVRLVSSRNPHSLVGTWASLGTWGADGPSSAARGWNRSKGDSGKGKGGSSWGGQGLEEAITHSAYLLLHPHSNETPASRLIMALLQDRKPLRTLQPALYCPPCPHPSNLVANQLQHVPDTLHGYLALVGRKDPRFASQRVKKLESATHSPLPLPLVLFRPRSRHRPQNRIHSTPRQSPC